jgi:hypothetical protein
LCGSGDVGGCSETKKSTLVVIAGICTVAVRAAAGIISKQPLSSGISGISPAPTTSRPNAGNNTQIIDESKYGKYNSEHVHAAFIIKVEGEQIDFSQDKYQLKSRFIHVENNDGTTLHRHATDVPFGDFLKSVGMNILDRCLVLDNGSRYCDHDNMRLRFFLNHTEVTTVMDYIIQNGDRLLIIYGNETDSQIKAELASLQKITIITVNR